MLYMPDLKERRSGALVVLYRYLGEHFKVGVGYNFTDFSDDLTDLSFDSKPVECDLFARTLDGDGEQEAYAAFVDRLRSRCGERALRSLGYHD